MSEFNPSASALTILAKVYPDLDPMDAVQKIADWIVEAIDDNHSSNNHGASVRKDWSNWNGAAQAIDVYADGPNAELWTGTGLFDDEQIYEAVEFLVNTEMDRRVENELEVTKSAVRNARELDDLESALNDADNYAEENEIDKASLYDATSLKTFGGDAIDEVGVYSWDAEAVLRYENNDLRWHTEPRA